MVEQWAEFLLNPFLGESERLAIPQLTEWQGIGNQIDAAMIFGRADFVNVHFRCGSQLHHEQLGKPFSDFFGATLQA